MEPGCIPITSPSRIPSNSRASGWNSRGSGIATALARHPECNAWWQDDHIRYWNEVHVSVAVAIEDGLITPVVRHADLKSLREIATEVLDVFRGQGIEQVGIYQGTTAKRLLIGWPAQGGH